MSTLWASPGGFRGKYLPGVGIVQMDNNATPTGQIYNAQTENLSAAPATVSTKAPIQYTPYTGLVNVGGKYYAKLADPNNQGTFGGYKEINQQSIPYYNLDPNVWTQAQGLKPSTNVDLGLDPNSPYQGFSYQQSIAPNSIYKGVTWNQQTPYQDYVNSQWGTGAITPASLYTNLRSQYGGGTPTPTTPAQTTPAVSTNLRSQYGAGVTGATPPSNIVPPAGGGNARGQWDVIPNTSNLPGASVASTAREVIPSVPPDTSGRAAWDMGIGGNIPSADLNARSSVTSTPTGNNTTNQNGTSTVSDADMQWFMDFLNKMGVDTTGATTEGNTAFEPSGLYKWELEQNQRLLDQKLGAMGRRNSTYATRMNSEMLNQLAAEEEQRQFAQQMAMAQLGLSASSQQSSQESAMSNLMANLLYGAGNTQGQMAYNYGNLSADDWIGLANSLSQNGQSYAGNMINQLWTDAQSNTGLGTNYANLLSQMILQSAIGQGNNWQNWANPNSALNMQGGDAMAQLYSGLGGTANNAYMMYLLQQALGKK